MFIRSSSTTMHNSRSSKETIKFGQVLPLFINTVGSNNWTDKKNDRHHLSRAVQKCNNFKSIVIAALFYSNIPSSNSFLRDSAEKWCVLGPGRRQEKGAAKMILASRQRCGCQKRCGCQTTEARNAWDQFQGTTLKEGAKDESESKLLDCANARRWGQV